MAEHQAKMRVVALVDMDAFYTQVEVKQFPELLRGKPVAVVQYNPWGDLQERSPEDPGRILPGSNGSIIAVSYEARSFGVKRRAAPAARAPRCMAPPPPPPRAPLPTLPCPLRAPAGT
jgi:nucleotidyltransferase/DNA polymerase involved in DNA repair